MVRMAVVNKDYRCNWWTFCGLTCVYVDAMCEEEREVGSEDTVRRKREDYDRDKNLAHMRLRVSSEWSTICSWCGWWLTGLGARPVVVGGGGCRRVAVE